VTASTDGRAGQAHGRHASRRGRKLRESGEKNGNFQGVEEERAALSQRPSRAGKKLGGGEGEIKITKRK